MMDKKIIDSKFISELLDVCDKYGVNFGTGKDNFGQVIFYTGLRQDDNLNLVKIEYDFLGDLTEEEKALLEEPDRFLGDFLDDPSSLEE